MALEDLVATASEAPAARRLRNFAEWVGEGRSLTQTGRLRRADALALVELLDTGDRLDPRRPIHSSAELDRLALVVDWAKACRLVRVMPVGSCPSGRPPSCSIARSSSSRGCSRRCPGSAM